jgi:hypothetical protein
VSSSCSYACASNPGQDSRGVTIESKESLGSWGLARQNQAARLCLDTAYYGFYLTKTIAQCMVFHAHNTEQGVDIAVAAICGWAAEMLEIEAGTSKGALPKAALQVYAMQAALA